MFKYKRQTIQLNANNKQYIKKNFIKEKQIKENLFKKKEVLKIYNKQKKNKKNKKETKKEVNIISDQKSSDQFQRQKDITTTQIRTLIDKEEEQNYEQTPSVNCLTQADRKQKLESQNLLSHQIRIMGRSRRGKLVSNS
ncbi:hypothetical protein TTHERM_000471949 (macronuclear) [Tetrahymena thermophila SB210]|uniref:Uncharacterized protein n=1 Tax=Tetrahymena thermophila (strain SB210) TaxID=312017 RepID=W7XAB0_TETTS|nr:hypothetical protein TTHERM_000471949 [Tetrahymena thermophila SB210]EWS73318.1 hypothetical protein TTHERM_000471949 [Tetrahymena thermophila SB210]|eukprot:XP_012654167.1 hypothetical protein TTHERM_000471949 [Tetrahymena thermophila SB210]